MPMKIQQTYTFCIAHAVCYLESNAEAAICDSPREVTPYIKTAEKIVQQFNTFSIHISMLISFRKSNSHS